MGKKNWTLFLENKSVPLTKLELVLILSTRKRLQKPDLSLLQKNPQISCFYCHKIGHVATRCYVMQKSYASKNAWAPRRPLRTNPQGPKMVWVPKAK